MSGGRTTCLRAPSDDPTVSRLPRHGVDASARPGAARVGRMLLIAQCAPRLSNTGAGVVTR